MEERTLTRKDLRRCWRAWMMHNLSSMSFERLESFGFCLSMLPVAKKLYPDAAQRTEMLPRHASFYNTEPQIGAIVNGMVLGLEEKKANGEPIDGETINTLKVGLMGPIAGIGDSMIPGMLFPILLSIGMALAAGGIPTAEDIEKSLDPGADRLGTSRAVKLLTSGEAGSGY